MTTQPSSKIPITEVLDPILLGDPVLQHLDYLHDLTIDNLTRLVKQYDRDMIKPTVRSVSTAYKTELLIHISYLLNQREMTYKELAGHIGLSASNISKNVRSYHLPQDFSPSSKWIDVKQVLQHFDKLEHAYHRHKVTLLHQIYDEMEVEDNLAKAARKCGVSEEKAEKWNKQYQIKKKLKNREPDNLSDIHRIACNLPVFEPSTQLQKIYVHPSTRLFSAEGLIYRAKELVAQPDLLNQQFLMMDRMMEFHTSTIQSAQLVEQLSTTITRHAGGEIILGQSTAVITDHTTGLLTEKVGDLDTEAALITIRHTADLGRRYPPVFELLQAPPGQPEVALVFTDKVAQQITTRLTYKYGTLKNAAKQLQIREKHGLAERQYRWSELQKIVSVLGYPDINHPEFMRQVKTMSYAIQGGRPIDTNDLKVDDDLLYLLGLIASDGYALENRKAVVGFNNKIKELVQIFRSILLKFFPTQTATIKEPSGSQVTYQIEFNNYPLRMIMYNLNIKGDEMQFDENDAYLPIFQLPNNLIIAFIRGLFDGDGNVDALSWKVSIAVFHEERCKNVQLLLKRLNIDSKVSYSFQQGIQPPNTTKPKDSDQWNIIIEGKKDIVKFHEIIRPRHPVRSEDLRIMVKRYRNRTSLSSKYNFAPKITGSLFRAVREDTGVSQNQICDKSEFGRFERGNARKSIKIVRKWFEKLQEFNPDTTTKQYILLKQVLQPVYNLDPVKEIEYTSGKKQLVELNVPSAIVCDTGIVITGQSRVCYPASEML